MESSSCTNDSSTAMMTLVSHGQSSQSKEWDSSSTTPTAPLSTPTPAPTSIPNEPPNDSSLAPLPTPNGGTKKKPKKLQLCGIIGRKSREMRGTLTGIILTCASIAE